MLFLQYIKTSFRTGTPLCILNYLHIIHAHNVHFYTFLSWQWQEDGKNHWIFDMTTDKTYRQKHLPELEGMGRLNLNSYNILLSAMLLHAWAAAESRFTL